MTYILVALKYFSRIDELNAAKGIERAVCTRATRVSTRDIKGNPSARDTDTVCPTVIAELWIAAIKAPHCSGRPARPPVFIRNGDVVAPEK